VLFIPLYVYGGILRFGVEGAKPLSMNIFYKYTHFIKNNLNSFIALPLIVSSLTGFNINLSEVKQTLTSVEMAGVETRQVAIASTEAKKIDAYFRDRSMPLAGAGEVFVREARKNNIDPFLVAAIAVRESSGGKNSCQSVPNSFLGWGSCRIGFDSTEQAIELVSWNLGGNNPNTAHFYAGKNTKAILQTYNPPSIVAEYAYEVMDIMERMRNYEI